MVETLWDRTTGTNIGDVSGGGGLTAAFDGTTSQAFAACAQHPSGSTSCYVGKTFGSPKAISKMIVFGSNDSGFVSAANPACSLKIYGKNGAAPSTGTDGTLLGSITFTDTANESAGRTVTSTDIASLWDHGWIYWLGDGSGGRADIAELQIYVMT
jgi:hypothetical protein